MGILKWFKFFSSVYIIHKNKRGVNKNYLNIWGFAGLSNNSIKDFVLNIIEFMSNNIDTILNISLLISCIILYINIPKAITIFLVKKEKKEKW